LQRKTAAEETSMSKYGNKKTAASDGKIFASKKECRRYEELLVLQRIGAIRCLQTQVEYVLIPKQVGERKCSYFADFVYYDAIDQIHVEDTKGFKTKDYIIKRKLMLQLGIRIEEL
jgi:hypothetical protein